MATMLPVLGNATIQPAWLQCLKVEEQIAGRQAEITATSSTFLAFHISLCTAYAYST